MCLSMLDEKKSLWPKCLLCMKMKNDLEINRKNNNKKNICIRNNIVIWYVIRIYIIYFIYVLTKRKFGCAVLKFLGNLFKTLIFQIRPKLYMMNVNRSKLIF